jgi:thioredoxin 1
MSSYAKYKDLGEGEKSSDSSVKSETNPIFPVFEIKTAEQKKQIISSHTVCVVKVWAEWCGPCKQIAKKYADLSKLYSRAGFCLLTKEQADLGLSPSVKGIPAFLFYKNGKFEGDIMGTDMKAVELKLKSLTSTE